MIRSNYKRDIVGIGDDKVEKFEKNERELIGCFRRKKGKRIGRGVDGLIDSRKRKGGKSEDEGEVRRVCKFDSSEIWGVDKEKVKEELRFKERRVFKRKNILLNKGIEWSEC